MKIEKIKKKLFEKQDLSCEEAEFLFERILIGEVNELDLCNILLALKLKGETSDEIAAAVKVLDKFKRRFKKALSPAIDTCGTGGDGKNTLNISTAVSIVASSAGIPVVKHGNSAQSSKIGSADILEKIGVPVKMDIFEAEKYFENKKFVFLFAPQFHPAIKKVTPARKKLGIRTIFNFIGPLVNPADPEFQIIGVAHIEKLETIAEAVKKAGKDNVILYSSEDGFDEISSNSPAHVYEINGEIKNFKINPEDFFNPFEMPIVENENDAVEKFKRAISGKDENLAKLIALNSAIIFYKIEQLKSIKEGFEYAFDILKSGKAMEKLNELVNWNLKLQKRRN